MLAVCMTTMALAAKDTTSKSVKPTINLAGRAGLQIEDQTANGKEIWNYTAPFIGGQLDLGIPVSSYISLNGLGVLDLAYGSGEYHQNTDFNEALARLKLQGTAAFNIPIDQLVLSPFAGLGLRYWKWGDPDPNFLHIETWTALYGVLGFRGEVRSERLTLFGQADIQIPFSETISVEGSNYDFKSADETFMLTAEAGMIIQNITISLFGEFFTYNNDAETGGIGSEINKTTLGAKLGIVF